MVPLANMFDRGQTSNRAASRCVIIACKLEVDVQRSRTKTIQKVMYILQYM